MERLHRQCEQRQHEAKPGAMVQLMLPPKEKGGRMNGLMLTDVHSRQCNLGQINGEKHAKSNSIFVV
jgi:hypothetical protein